MPRGGDYGGVPILRAWQSEYIYNPSTTDGTTTTGWIPFRKPKSASMFKLFVLGSAAGGGGGFTGASGTARGGGGGGGTGAGARLLIEADELPDVLYLFVGAGGAGGSAGGAGGAGQLSYIATAPNSTSTAAAIILVSGAAVAQGGGGGTGAAAGALGAAGTISDQRDHTPAGLGIWQGIQGQAGVAGGVQTGNTGGATNWGGGGSNIAPFPICGGPGGGGVGTNDTNQAGGACNGGGLIPTLAGGLAAAGAGADGYHRWKPFYSLPGTGGGTAGASGTGGKGGNSGIGSGGAGGGGGVTGGAGGNGGSGLIVISWT